MFESREEFEEALAKSNQIMVDELEKANMKSGFFNMDHVRAATENKDHGAAKADAHAAVDSAKGATPGNVAKAKQMINRSRNSGHLAQGMVNFLLAHPSEDLGMTKSREEFEESLAKCNEGMEEELSKAAKDAKLVSSSTPSEKPTGEKGGYYAKQEKPDKDRQAKSASKKPSFFNMNHVNEVTKKKTHADAKAHAHSIVDGYMEKFHKKEKSKDVDNAHVKKTRVMIDNSKSTAHLARTMSSFILAHPSENLAVGRGSRSIKDTGKDKNAEQTEGEKIDTSVKVNKIKNKGKEVNRVANPFRMGEAGGDKVPKRIKDHDPKTKKKDTSTDSSGKVTMDLGLDAPKKPKKTFSNPAPKYKAKKD